MIHFLLCCPNYPQLTNNNNHESELAPFTCTSPTSDNNNEASDRNPVAYSDPTTYILTPVTCMIALMANRGRQPVAVISTLVEGNEVKKSKAMCNCNQLWRTYHIGRRGSSVHALIPLTWELHVAQGSFVAAVAYLLLPTQYMLEYFCIYYCLCGFPRVLVFLLVVRNN